MTPSETPGHGRARGSARNTREMRLATLTLLLPLYVAVGFATNFIGALHDSEAAPREGRDRRRPGRPPRFSRVRHCRYTHEEALRSRNW